MVSSNLKQPNVPNKSNFQPPKKNKEKTIAAELKNKTKKEAKLFLSQLKVQTQQTKSQDVASTTESKLHQLALSLKFVKMVNVFKVSPTHLTILMFLSQPKSIKATKKSNDVTPIPEMPIDSAPNPNSIDSNDAGSLSGPVKSVEMVSFDFKHVQDLTEFFIRRRRRKRVKKLLQPN